MSPLKTPRNVILCLVVMLCFLPSSTATETSDADEAARLLATASDNPTTRDEREAALKKLEAAAQLLINAGNKTEAARVLNRAGRLQLRLNNPNAAINSHQQALSLLSGGPATEIQVDNLNGLGAAYVHLQKLDLAEPVLQEALALSERSGYTAGQAQALLTLSDLHNNDDNHLVALQLAQQALILWQNLNDKPQLELSYCQVAQCYLAQHLLSEATQNYQTALQLAQDQNDKAAQAGALSALGFIEYRKGSWQDAIAYHTRAQELIDEKDEPKRMGQVAAGLGESFNESGSPEAGLIHFRRAEEYYRQIGDPSFIAYAIFGQGRSYYLLGNYAEAANQFQRAIAEVRTESLQAAQFREHLGRVSLATHQPALALQYLQPTLAAYMRSFNQMEAAQVQGLIAEAYQQQGRFQLARQYYQQSLEAFDKLSDRLNQSAILFALGRLELQQENLDLAENHLRQSIAATENIRRVSTSTDLAAAFSATIQERYESYIECLMRIAKTRGATDLETRAFEISESARSRSLIELLRATQTSLVSGLDPGLAEQEKSLRQSLRVKEDYKVQLLAGTYKQEELAALESELSDLETKYKQVTNTIRERYPAYDHISQTGGWTLDQIQQQVIADNDTLLLEYSLGVEKSFVWAVTRDHIKSYELPGRAHIDEAAQRVYRLLIAGGDAEKKDELLGATRELGQLILLPVAAELPRKRVIVVADGALHYVPFSILPPSSSNDEPLVAQLQVINAPSASILGQLRAETARRQIRTRSLAAFGDPVFATNYAERKDPSGTEVMGLRTAKESRLRAVRDAQAGADIFDPAKLQTLFFSRLELANLREVAGPDSFVATSFDATKEKLASFNLSNFAILHFATHGFLDPRHPENSGLVLSMVDRQGHAQNGFVGLQDIYRLQAPVDLVVLSACRTGLGKEVRGEGLIGLTRGFMYAGASSVIASLWTVDDEATSELMKRFYANLLQRHLNPAEALQAAQNSIRSEPQWRSPYFWAAFTLQGEYRQTIAPSRSGATAARKVVLIGAAAILLLGILGWWFWRSRRKAVSLQGH